MKTSKFAFKESAYLKIGCLRYEMIQLIDALLETAPETTDGIMWITEAWREPLHTDDAHTWCNAIDIRSWNVIYDHEYESTTIILNNWAVLTKDKLGRHSPYQFLAHGEGSNFHLHAEYDPR